MPADATLSPESAGQLRLLDESLWYILLIIAGVLISYCLTAQQRQALLCAALGQPVSPEDTRPLRLLSSLLILSAVLFFFLLSEKAAQTPADSAQKNASNQANYIASGLALAAGLVRLWDLLYLQESA